MALRVVRARLDRDRDGLLVFFVCIILFCVAAAVDSFTNLLVAAAPVVMLASCITIAGPTAHASLVDLKVVEAICDAAAAKSAAGTRVAA